MGLSFEPKSGLDGRYHTVGITFFIAPNTGEQDLYVYMKSSADEALFYIGSSGCRR